MKNSIRVLLTLGLATVSLWSWAADFNSARVPVWSATGDKFYLRANTGGIDVYSVNGQVLWSSQKKVSEALFSSDATQIAYSVPSEGLFVYSFPTGKTATVSDVRASKKEISNVNWAPSGSKVGFWLATPQGATAGVSDYVLVSPDGKNPVLVTSRNVPALRAVPTAMSSPTPTPWVVPLPPPQETPVPYITDRPVPTPPQVTPVP